MTTFQTPSLLSKPDGDDQISKRALGYVAGATRLDLHELVLEAFKEAGISQSTLAKRLGKRPEQVSRLLGAPGNWTIDTAAELLFAIEGSLLRLARRFPLEESPRNSHNVPYIDLTRDLIERPVTPSANTRASTSFSDLRS